MMVIRPILKRLPKLGCQKNCGTVTSSVQTIYQISSRCISAIRIGNHYQLPNQQKIRGPSTLQRSSVRYTYASSTHIEPFILPDIGEGINEVEIKDWSIKVGDKVREFDSLCEVESDKATATISSRFEGTIAKIHYEVGDMAKVGTPLVDIEIIGGSKVETKMELSRDEATNEASNFESQTTQSDRETQEHHIATLPSVRRLAMERGADLSKVTPTGKNGRILREDLLRYLEGGSSVTESSNTAPCFNNQSFTTKQVSRGESKVPLRGIRRAMFKTMTQSAAIPHFNYSDEIDMTRLVHASAERSPDKKVSNFAIIIKMVSLALNEYPELNGSVDESGEFMTTKHYHNIGIAVDSQSGLIVPNIKNVENLTITEINTELSRLRQLAYDSKLGPADLAGGTFTLSNIGAVGGIFGVPLLVPSELVIGALGRTRKLPRFNSLGQVEARDVMQLVWSADHRVVDGATLSRFTNFLKTLLEHPENAVLKMR